MKNTTSEIYLHSKNSRQLRPSTLLCTGWFFIIMFLTPTSLSPCSQPADETLTPVEERGQIMGYTIKKVEPDSCYAGFQIQSGDIITFLNNRRFNDAEAILPMWRQARQGER